MVLPSAQYRHQFSLEGTKQEAGPPRAGGAWRVTTPSRRIVPGTRGHPSGVPKQDFRAFSMLNWAFQESFVKETL